MNDNMTIRNIDSWKEWEGLITSAIEYTFLQSWEAGSLQEQMAHGVRRFVVLVDGVDCLAAQTIVVAAKRGKVLQLRHAPVFLAGFYSLDKGMQNLVVHEFLAEIRDYAINQRCDFVRLQGLVHIGLDTDTDSNNPLLEMLPLAGYKPANIHNVDAEKTLLLDIRHDEDTLQKNMRKQTRYYIRKAGKMGVSVSRHNTLESLEKFYKIHHDTTVRQKFKSYSHDYYQKSFEAFNSLLDSKLSAEIFLAEYEGKNIAGAIIVYYGRKAFYSDGGSLTEYSKVPASYLIQWEAIKRAKELGCESYNFWGGVSPDKENQNYPWYGIDLFKRGFGGDRVEYMHAHDLGLTWKYRLTRLWERLEKARRGY